MTKQRSQQTAISLDMTPARITAALVDTHGTVSAVHSLPTPVHDGSEAVLETLLMLCRTLLDQTPADEVAGIGISTVGLVHHRTGKIIHAAKELAILQNMPLAESIQEALHMTTRVENNVNAMALAESYYGAGVGCENFFYIFADANLNGAIVQNGEIWHGSHFSAGQISTLVAGWMSQKPITLGQKASGTGIVAEYSMRSRKFRLPPVRDILQFAKHGDQLAIRVVRDGAHLLASVLSPIVSLIDPQRVVVGGILTTIGDLWWMTFLDTLRDSPLPALQEVEVAQAQIKDNAALIGAAMLVLREDSITAATNQE